MQRIINQPLARSNDPITSFEAAESVCSFIDSHESRIILHLSRNGPMGVDFIAAHADIDPHAVGKRMKALQERGVVELTGRTVKSDSGRNQREWRLV